MQRFFLTVSLFAALGVMPRAATPVVTSPLPQDTLFFPTLIPKTPKELAQERRESNAKEFRAAKLADSITWEKIQRVQGKAVLLEDLKARREKRRAAIFSELCTSTRFPAPEEVDSVPGLTNTERANCKEKVALAGQANP